MAGTGRLLEQAAMRLAGIRTIPDRLVSLADPGARPIRKGKPQHPTQFGYTALVAEDESGFVVDHPIHRGNPADAPQLVPAVERVTEPVGRVAATVVADREFGTVAPEDAIIRPRFPACTYDPASPSTLHNDQGMLRQALEPKRRYWPTFQVLDPESDPEPLFSRRRHTIRSGCEVTVLETVHAHGPRHCATTASRDSRPARVHRRRYHHHPPLSKPASGHYTTIARDQGDQPIPTPLPELDLLEPSTASGGPAGSWSPGPNHSEPARARYSCL